MRVFAALVFRCAALLALASQQLPAMAAYPERPVTIVVGAAPGASGDLVARMIAERLSVKWKTAVVVDNKSGAGGLLATNDVKNARPDGHTIYISNDSAAINEVAQKNKGFEHLDVFAPISLLALIDFKLVVHPSVPARTVSELIAYAKANPGKLNYASSGQFTPHHLMAEQFRLMSGIQVTHVPFRGTAPAILALVSRQVDFAFSGFPAVDEQIKAGQLRELASTGAQRNRASPNLPTVGETLPGFSAGSWWAMWVRKDVPQPIRDELARSVRDIIAAPDVQERMKKGGLEPVGSDPEALRAFQTEEVAKLRKLPAEVTSQ